MAFRFSVLASSLRRCLQASALMLLGLAASAGLGELALRGLGVSHPVFVRPDPVLGYSLRPGAAGITTDEGQAFVSVNSDGMRDVEHQKPKPRDTFRIALLGDSYAEARQVEIEEAWWKVAEARLRGCAALSHKTPEILNFGVSGYGTAQELLTLQTRVWNYEPDLILLAFTSNNDMSDNVRSLRSDDTIPYFTLDGRALLLDNSFRQSAGYRARNSWFGRLSLWAVEHSRVAQLINRARFVLRQRSMDRERRARFGADGSDKTIYAPPSHEAWRYAWEITERLVAAIAQETTRHDKSFVLLTVSNPEQVFPDRDARDALLAQYGGTDIFYPEKRMTALGEKEGFPVITLAPYLQQVAEREKLDLHRASNSATDGHWNADGHRFAGEYAADALCKLLISETNTAQQTHQ